MGEYLLVLALTALPAFGNLAGGLLAEFVGVSKRVLSLALHAAAGIVLAVVGVELIPRVLEAELPWVVILAFVAGGAFSVVLDRLVDVLQTRFSADANSGGHRESGGAWLIYLAVATDLFTDGLIIGIGTTFSTGLGFLLALGQLPADIPEGFASIATFKDAGLPRSKRLLLSASFALPVVLGATIGFWIVRGQSELFKLVLLAFTAAILLVAAVEDIMTEAHSKADDARLQQLALTGGFALFMLLALYLG